MTPRSNAQHDLHQHLELLRHMRQSLPKPPGFAYTCIEDFLLDRGRDLDPSTAIVTPGTPKQCYWNARRAANRKGWTYYEGYAISIIPMLHAWCLDEQGRLRELTWREVGDAYFGVPIPLSELDPKAPYLDNWMGGFPALRLPRLTRETT